MSYVESIAKVLAIGLILGAGLPAVFAVGLRTYSHGAGDAATARPANPALRLFGVVLFALVGAVILMALLWITRSTIEHHFGVDLFPFAQ